MQQSSNDAYEAQVQNNTVDVSNDEKKALISDEVLQPTSISEQSGAGPKPARHVQLPPSSKSLNNVMSTKQANHEKSPRKSNFSNLSRESDEFTKKMLLPDSFANIDMDGAKSHNHIASKLLGHRDKLMQLFMAKRQDDYISREPFRLFAGTWNVNGQIPPQSIADWLASDLEAPDIYVIGFQELDLSKEAFVFSESSREEEWKQVVSSSLHPQEKYRMVRLIRLVGIMLLVYVAKKHVGAVKQVCAHYVGTGLLGRMGNKGGVAIRFNLHSSTICVVNSHLAAHADFTQRRNEDFKEICSRTQFSDPESQGFLNIFQHDVLIWVGDLNYRIEGLAADTVKDCIDREQYKLLKEHDQLLIEQGENNAFQGFEEGEINFRPTYKYKPGTDEWDSSEKCRIPAWCDRILWKEVLNTTQSKKHGKSVHLVAYRSHQELKISDHKPVSALFDVDIKVINKESYRQVYEEEIRRMDKMENEWLPALTLDTHTIDFGDVRFHDPIQRSLELHNTGQIPCHFEFIPKFQESSYCQPWLTINKPKGFIMPDDTEVIELEVYVNRTTVADLNIGVQKLEDILILHLVGGKDFFITVHGRYLPSCFGMPLEVLCELKEPIRDVPQSDILALSRSNHSSNSTTGSKVPKELWRLLDHLFHNALTQEDLFEQPGLHSEIQTIQESLDCELPTISGVNHLPGSNHSVVEALLVFLESLPDPVIPFTYYNMCLEVSNDFPRAKELVNTLPSYHRCLFFYLIAFLQELLKYKKSNGLAMNYLGNIFGGLMLRPAKRKLGLEAKIEKDKAYSFIEKFLINPIDDY